MEFLKLYEKENKEILKIISFLNKNSSFDKSIGDFNKIDLFTFLENVNEFDFTEDYFYDDVYYIIDYVENSIFHLINNINYNIKREHKIVPLAQAKEFDKKCIIWLSKQNGRTIKEKLNNNKIKTVKRYKNIDTYENRIFKILLKKLVLSLEARKDISSKNEVLFYKIKYWLRSEEANSINEYGKIVFNNLLIHHPHYSKVFKSFKWLNRLDEKVNTYLADYPNQVYEILYFSVLAKLQFTTNEPILPKRLKINYDCFSFDDDFKKPLLLNKEDDKIFNDYFSNNINTNLNSIDKHTNSIINLLNVKTIKNRKFGIKHFEEKPVYIDLFKLYPVVRVDQETTKFPITIKQKINNEIVNANNTKIIDLNYNIYTLPYFLKSLETNILRIFLNDLQKYLNTKYLNYIIPDYINVFEFSEIKNTIASVFPKNRNVPTSVLAGLKYLFNKKAKKNDTIVFVQKNFKNEIYVTPLLVKLNPSLKSSITSGLYLERHPTRRLENDNCILRELNKDFNDEISSDLLCCFLESGINEIKKENVQFYYNNEKISLNKQVKNYNKRKINAKRLKELFKNQNLFISQIIQIEENTEENLLNFSKLLALEAKGNTLWKEHLPYLAMQLPIDGYLNELILVDDNSKIEGNNIQVKSNFSIPAGAIDLKFPLILGDEHINFEAYLASDTLPLKNQIECKLLLTYDYEAEIPYELRFISLDKSIKPIKVKWRKRQKIIIGTLPIPDFPVRKTWSDFKRHLKEDGKRYSNLFKWVREGLNDLNRTESFFLKGRFIRTNIYGSYFYINVLGGEERYRSSDLKDKTLKLENLKQGDEVYIKRTENAKVYLRSKACFIKINEEVENKIFNSRFPVFTIWNHEHSLLELQVPQEFRIAVHNGVKNAIKIINHPNVSSSLKNELFLFLCCLQQDAPEYASKRLIREADKKESFERYYRNIAYSIGGAKLPWQKILLSKILSYIKVKHSISSTALKTLSIALWRSENLIERINNEDILQIYQKLYYNLKLDLNLLKKMNQTDWYTIQESTKHLELLLGLMRTRINFDKDNPQLFLSPNHGLTKSFVSLIDKITKVIVEKEIKLKSRIDFMLNKPDTLINTPDLLYTLRVYLTGDSGNAKGIKVVGVRND